MGQVEAAIDAGQVRLMDASKHIGRGGMRFPGQNSNNPNETPVHALPQVTVSAGQTGRLAHKHGAQIVNCQQEAAHNLPELLIRGSGLNPLRSKVDLVDAPEDILKVVLVTKIGALGGPFPDFSFIFRSKLKAIPKDYFPGLPLNGSDLFYVDSVGALIFRQSENHSTIPLCTQINLRALKHDSHLIYLFVLEFYKGYKTLHWSPTQTLTK